jgi:hypothetical protein
MPQHGATRRRLAKAGLGAAGVLMTLESHATLQKTGFVCESASAFHSAGLNSNVATEQRCNPLSPSNWCHVQRSWPCNKAKRFADVFSCREQRFEKTYFACTMAQVMTSTFDSQYAYIGKHLCTAYLNVISGRISFLDVPTLQRMWNELKTTGFYKVNANVSWNIQQVRKYLVAVHGE